MAQIKYADLTALGKLVTNVKNLLAGKVPTSRTINGKALTGNITLTPSDIGAESAGAASSALSEAKSYTDTELAALVGTAPETMDTLQEVAAAIAEHQDVTDALNASIGNKVDKVSGKGLSTNDYTTTEKNKLAGIAADAEVNQNAFSNVTVGTTTIAADGKTDTLTLAGSNVTLTPDATNDKVTIGITKDNVTSALGYTPPTKDTTYSAASSSAAGLMSAADKSKLDGIQASADAVTFTQSLTSGTKVGSISINGTSTDLYAPTDTDTHYTTHLKVGASATATANAAASNGSVHMNVLDNTTVRDSHKITGAGSVTVTSDANGNITITGTDEDTTYSAASSSAAGLMSAADKSKLDGIQASADAVSFARSVNSGTKIGAITINGTATDIYAPSATDTHINATISATKPTGDTIPGSLWFVLK